jgi:transglutaminase-like putative cysteine protease/tetratricopeptide (TPR) repeat protein
MRLNVTKTAFLLASMLLAPLTAIADTGYADKAGDAAGVFRNDDLNFQLDLDSTSYVIVDLSEQMPDASFAAMRFDPTVFLVTIAEDLGTDMSVEQYAEIVKIATIANMMTGDRKATLADIEDLGERRIGDVSARQFAVGGDVDGIAANYVVTTFVNGTMAYQLTVFSGGEPTDKVLAEAETIVNAFSFPGEITPQVRDVKQVEDYESASFAYRMKADNSIWFPWSDYKEDYPYADIGALGAKGYGAVVLPFCWDGDRPNQLALLDVFMEQFGEDYPTAFITQEEAIDKDGLPGIYMSGMDLADGEEYLYEFRLTANASCAYMFGSWGPNDRVQTREDSARLWADIEFLDSPQVLTGGDASIEEQANNAFFLNQLGMHYYEARSHRVAFAYLSQATDLALADSAYLLNALRVLTEIDAYQEAYDWLQPRLEIYPDNIFVRSWDAWLSYQTGDTEKSIGLYETLFAEGYREDDEFAVYMEMLAEREDWERLDEDFEQYAAGGMTDSLRRLKATLLSRRGRYDEALAILDAMDSGRAFSAELTYARIDVYDEMDNFPELLKLSELLIDSNYESLESWFYKGYSEYQLKSYLKSRESFEKAQKYSPTNTVIKDYISSINGILGEGDNASINTEITAVALPADLQNLIDRPSLKNSSDGYGAFFLNRIIGYRFDGGDYVSKSFYQQIKVQDTQGIEQFSTLEFNFDPAFEQLYVNSLVVRNANGDVVAEADRASFYVTTTVDGYEASTEQTAHLPVPSLAPGMTIDVVVSKLIGVEQGELPLEIQYLSTNRPIEYSAVYVTGDHDKYAYEAFGVNEPRESGDSFIWEMTDPVVYRWEPLQPYYDRMLPWVHIGTTSGDWNVAGTDYFGKIEDKLDTSRVADTANRLVRGVDDDVRKIELISNYVQKELHYEAIEFGRRAYVPKTARETLRDRYGDCKDHAVLLYSMLNAIDIPAELALVNLSQAVQPGLPNVDQFDHMIVAVPQSDGRLFIDATDKDFGLGTRPPRYLAGNHALLIGTSSELVAIPDFEPGDSTLHVDREIEKMEGNEITITEVATLSGFQAADLRGQLRDVETSEMLTTMQRWVAARYSDAIVEDAFVDHLFEPDSELIVELQYRLPIDTDESFKLPGFFETEYLEYARVADRRFVFEMPVPFSVSSVTTVRQPSQAKLALASKKPDADESRFANWSRKVDEESDSWIFRLEYSGRRSEYGADEYGEFAEFHRRLIGTIEQPLILE